MNAGEFIQWFGNELQELILTTNGTYRFTATRDLVGRAINNLSEMPPADREKVSAILATSHLTNKIGDFRVPYDIRDEYDTIEAVLATVEGFFEE